MLSVHSFRIPVISFACSGIIAAITFLGALNAQRTSPPPQTLATGPVATTPVAITQTAVTNAPLFGKPELPASTSGGVRAEISSPISKSNASYQLFGLIASDSQGPRRVILGTDPSSQIILREGDRAPEGEIVRAIRERDILLDRAGALESLALPDEYLPASTPEASFAPPNSAIGAQQEKRAEQAKAFILRQREAAIARGETPIFDAPQ